MSMLVGYLGAALVGVGLAVFVAAGLRRGARTPAAVGLREATVTDLHQRRLAQGLILRLGTPVVDRFVALSRRVTPGARGTALRLRLDNAGHPVSVEAFLALKAVAAGGGVLVAVLWALLTGPTPARLLAAAGIGAVLGSVVPELLVHSRGARRQAELSRSLTEGLDLLALTVQAGLGLEQGVAEVAEEIGGPLGDELDRMLKEQQLGWSRREALHALHARNRSEDVRTLVNALLHADRLGTPMADTLHTQARELRRRRRASAREQAGKAPVKLLFPLIFGIFPAMFIIIMGPGAMSVAQSLLGR